MPWGSREGALGLTGPAPRPSEQERMEQAIRAELWEVLDTSDLESVTSKEVGRGVPCLAQSVLHATLDIGVMSSSPHVVCRAYSKKNNKSWAGAGEEQGPGESWAPGRGWGWGWGWGILPRGQSFPPVLSQSPTPGFSSSV